MTTSQISVSLIGSFRQHYNDVVKAARIFADSGMHVLSPADSRIINPGEGYVRFESDSPNCSNEALQAKTFEKLFASDVVYVVAPNGYIGPATCLELGRLLERGIPVYYSEPPRDLPILIPPDKVVSPSDFAALVLSTRLSRPRIKPMITADLLVLTIREELLHVLAVRRATNPYRGMLALPGGFVRPGESLEAAAHRELMEETGLVGAELPLRQLGTYSTPDRDPRERVISTAFLAVAANLPEPRAGSDADSADWVEVEDSLSERLAFDHAIILADAVTRTRELLEHTTIALDFCAAEFTISELRRVHETISGDKIDASGFTRKMKHWGTDFIEPVGDKRRHGIGRPAALYRRIRR